ncbi:putative inactive purple acid phosphatase 1 [Morella rubra]|uniref:Putative inactive purple acid phosphatase 1 n=1 Tax=Morella rubra TaxID=262757 RepID=A0A6A1VWR2_9ROSI|nr:putative inactive purple acid phosphatase 1 [Morella rubra]
MTWRRVTKFLQALMAHGLLFSFTLLLALKLQNIVPYSWCLSGSGCEVVFIAIGSVLVAETPGTIYPVYGSSTCLPDNEEEGPCPYPPACYNQVPYICTTPIKFKYANFSNSKYTKTGKAVLKFQLINQRADFSFAVFSGSLLNPKLISVSNFISFANPKAPLYPRLAQGKSWNEMTVTWTCGYALTEAVPFVEWGLKGETQIQSPAGTWTVDRNSMCGILTGWAITYLMVHTSGAKRFPSNHHHILARTHYNA